MISCSAMFHFTAHRYSGGGTSSKRVKSCIQVLSSAKLLYPYIWLRSLAGLMRVLICLRQVHWHQSPPRPSVDRQARRLMDCFWHIAVTFLLFHTLHNWFDFDKHTRTFFSDLHSFVWLSLLFSVTFKLENLDIFWKQYLREAIFSNNLSPTIDAKTPINSFAQLPNLPNYFTTTQTNYTHLDLHWNSIIALSGL